MKTNTKLLLLSIFVLILCICSIVYSLHNIDLSWNAKYVDLIDCNGVMCATVTEMYNMSMLRLVFMLPITMGVAMMVGYYARRLENGN